MKAWKIWTLGLLVAFLCFRMVLFAVSFYPEIKEIEEREQYLDSLDWVLEVGDYIAFSPMDYECENLIYRNYGKSTDGGTVGMVTPDGRFIVPCQYEHILYHGGDYFAAVSDENWYIFDFDGREIARLVRDDEHLYYAGGTYFFYYPDFTKMGFQIVDGMSGDVVKSFPDAYNGHYLSDGTWYISETVNTIDFDRQIFDEVKTWDFGGNYFKPLELSTGYFLNEQFDSMYYGEKYLLCFEGEGYKIAEKIVDGGLGDCVFLDEEKEQFSISRNSGLYGMVEALYDSYASMFGIVLDKDGNIGLIEQNGEGDDQVFYYNQEGQWLYDVKIKKHDLVVNYNQEGFYQIMDAEKNIVLEPHFSSIEILGNGDYAIVYSYTSDRHGIIDLRELM